MPCWRSARDLLLSTVAGRLSCPVGWSTSLWIQPRWGETIRFRSGVVGDATTDACHASRGIRQSSAVKGRPSRQSEVEECDGSSSKGWGVGRTHRRSTRFEAPCLVMRFCAMTQRPSSFGRRFYCKLMSANLPSAGGVRYPRLRAAFRHRAKIACPERPVVALIGDEG